MSNNAYDNLDFCLNTLFDYVYNKASDKCYIFKPILRHSIKLIDLKKSESFDPSEVFGGDLKFINFVNNRWNFKRVSESSPPCTVSIGKYKSSNDVNNMESNEIYNMAMMYMGSEIVINDKFKHMILPIMMFDIESNKLKELFPKVSEHIDDMEKTNLFYVLVTEHYFKMSTLKEYLIENMKTMNLQKWKVLFFQVLFSLAKLTERFNKFRHNNLNLDSIKIYTRKENDENDTHKLGDSTFIIPNVGFDIKLGDFDEAYTSDYKRNINRQTDNPYYDIHYFFNSLYLFLKNQGGISVEIEKFITDMIPDKFLTKDKKFTGLDEHYFDSVSSKIIIPSLVIKQNSFFSEFISNNTNIGGKRMDLSVSPIFNKRINKKKLETKESGIRYTISQTSPTDGETDEPRMLGKKVLSNNKKSKEYYTDMVRGSRKITVPGLKNIDSTSEGDVFSKAEKSINKYNENADDSVTPTSAVEENNDKVEEDLKKVKKDVDGEKEDSSSVSYDVADTVAPPSSSNKDFIEAMNELSRHTKKGKKSRKMKRESTSESSSSASSDNMKGLDPKFKEQLSRLPKNYMGEVPPHILQSLQSQEQGMNPMAQMMGQMPQMDPSMLMMQQQMMGQQMDQSMMMPQMMPQMGPQMMPQMGPQMMPQMGSQMMPQMGPQMMPQMGQMMEGAVMDNPAQYNQALNMPSQMPPQMMQQMQQQMGQMTGGGKRYKLKKNKNFFF